MSCARLAKIQLAATRCSAAFPFCPESDPCIPKDWPGFEVTLRHGSATYHIRVENPDGVSRGIASAELAETVVAERPLHIPLVDDGATHILKVRLGVTSTRHPTNTTARG